VLAVPLITYLVLRKGDAPARVSGASGASSASGDSISPGAGKSGDSSGAGSSGAGAPGGTISSGAVSSGAGSSGAVAPGGTISPGAVAAGGAIAPHDDKTTRRKPTAGTKSERTKPGDVVKIGPSPLPDRPAGKATDKADKPGTTPFDKPSPGTLAIRVKPECEIYVDGKLASPRTSYRELSLAAGRHQITLINREQKIEDRFVVETRSGYVDRVVKEYGDKRNATINPFEKGSK
jgi:hypothetical protein